MTTCGKIQYDNIHEAQVVANGLNRKTGNNRESKVYLCPDCGYYHITSQQKSVIRNRTLKVINLKKMFPSLTHKEMEFIKTEATEFLRKTK